MADTSEVNRALSGRPDILMPQVTQSAARPVQLNLDQMLAGCLGNITRMKKHLKALSLPETMLGDFLFKPGYIICLVDDGRRWVAGDFLQLCAFRKPMSLFRNTESNKYVYLSVKIHNNGSDQLTFKFFCPKLKFSYYIF